jgi:subtilisin family serine protease
MAAVSDFDEGVPTFENLGDAATLYFDNLGLALLAPSGATMSVASSKSLVASVDAIANIEPETFVFPCEAFAEVRELAAQTEQSVTWGLTATRVPQSGFSGRGIKVAVLDTGLDLGHPDFAAGQSITTSSHVPGEPVQDLNRHGTHCIGTACGPRSPAGVPRYGIAYEAHIFAGKVLSNSGIGTVAGVLAGLNWAIANRCEVISMSLSGAGGPYQFYQEAARRALAAGCLIIAAAGNDSRRPAYIAPTGAPANSPDVVAVAALDRSLDVAYFSSGGKIEIAAPGVDILSSLPRPRLHGSLSGTSMATPHVAGIAALLAESNPALRGAALRDALLQRALPLSQPEGDVGRGLVQA